jgi:hypothetical protein
MEVVWRFIQGNSRLIHYRDLITSRARCIRTEQRLPRITESRIPGCQLGAIRRRNPYKWYSENEQLLSCSCEGGSDASLPRRSFRPVAITDWGFRYPPGKALLGRGVKPHWHHSRHASTVFVRDIGLFWRNN